MRRLTVRFNSWPRSVGAIAGSLSRLSTPADVEYDNGEVVLELAGLSVRRARALALDNGCHLAFVIEDGRGAYLAEFVDQETAMADRAEEEYMARMEM